MQMSLDFWEIINRLANAIELISIIGGVVLTIVAYIFRKVPLALYPLIIFGLLSFYTFLFLIIKQNFSPNIDGVIFIIGIAVIVSITGYLIWRERRKNSPNKPNGAVEYDEKAEGYYLVPMGKEKHAKRIAKTAGCNVLDYWNTTNRSQNLWKLGIHGTEGQIKKVQEKWDKHNIKFLESRFDPNIDEYYSDYNPPPEPGMLWSNQMQTYYRQYEPSKVNEILTDIKTLRENLDKFRVDELEPPDKNIHTSVVHSVITTWHRNLDYTEKKLNDIYRAMCKKL